MPPYAHVSWFGSGVLCPRQLGWWWCPVPTSARLVVVFYAYVSSSGGGVLCLPSAILMVVPCAYVSSSDGGVLYARLLF